MQAFAWFDADHALAAARMLHLVSRRGPLHGLPFAVKDNIDTQEMPTGYGSAIYDGHRPDIDAIRRSRLKKKTLFEMDDEDDIITARAQALARPRDDDHALDAGIHGCLSPAGERLARLV